LVGVTILTDSTADLGADLAYRRDIGVIPLAVNIGGHSFKDGVDVRPARLFSLVDQYGELPKTSAPSVPDYAQAFADGGDSVYVGISSQLSSSVQNALLASRDLPPGRALVVDSFSLSTGIGLLALRAADLRDQGVTAAEIEATLLAAVPKLHVSFAIDTLRYLHMGGRCSALQSLVGSVLQVRPVIDVRPDGTLGVKAKTRGPRRRALQTMLDDLSANLAALDRDRVCITHAGCPDDAAFLAEEVQRMASPREVLVTEAGAVISSHCGPGCVGILYLTR
jgi:DegV family protein with EDD domain